MFTEADDLVGIDLDTCRDTETGQVNEFATSIVRELDSYSEVSPSGRGIHIILRGTLPHGWRRTPGIEVYDRGRYFTVTGECLPDTRSTIEERSEALTRLHRRLQPGMRLPATSPEASQSGHNTTPDSKTGSTSRMQRLREGDISGYPSHSEADLAFCGYLLRQTNGDTADADCLFRESGLYRPKWDKQHRADGATYGQMTLAKATEGLGLPTALIVGPRDGQPNADEALLNDADGDADGAIQRALGDEAAMDALVNIGQARPGHVEALYMKLKGKGALTRNVEALRRAIGQTTKLRAPTPAEDPAASTNDEAQPVCELLPGAPVSGEITVPSGWELDEDGLHQDSNHIVPSPIVVTQRYKDIADGTEHVELAWLRDGVWQKQIVARRNIADARAIVALADVGLPVTSENARHVVRYLADFEAQNLPHLQPARVSAHMGWLGRDGEFGFLWGQELLTERSEAETQVAFRGADVGDDQIAQGYCSAGSLPGWKSAVGDVAQYPRALLGVYAALTPPLLQILSAPNFIVDWAFSTSTGKTTTLRLGASCWGNPDERSTASTLWAWDATRVWIERVSACLNGLPLILDDTKRARKTGDISQTLYDVASGRGRGRGSAGGLRHSGSWSTVLLSSGEASVTDFSQDGGTRARTIQLWGPPFGPPNEQTGPVVESVNRAVRENYGHAGPELVRYLLDNRNRWEKWRAEYHRTQAALAERASSDAVAGRISGYLAALCIAAKLAHEALELPWSYSDPIDHIYDEVIAEGGDADRAATALSHVMSYARAHEHAFYGRHLKYEGKPHPAGAGWVGYWKAEENWDSIGFHPHRLRAIIEEGRFDAEAMLRVWRDREWLIVGKDRKRNTMKVRVGRESAWLVVVRRAAIEEVEGQ